MTRRAVADLDEAGVGENIIIALTPLEYRASGGRGPFRVNAADAAGLARRLTIDRERLDPNATVHHRGGRVEEGRVLLVRLVDVDPAGSHL